MTQEQKAKAYDEALEKAKNVLETDLHESGVWAITKIFPELKESEDERIRKAIVALIEDLQQSDKNFAGVELTDMIAWLEKQKINTEGDFGRGYDCGYKACLNSHGAEFFEKQKEQKEIPMPNSTELIEMWDKEEAMLKEKDFRGDEWRLAYNAFLDGFARGTCVKSEKQKEQKPADSVKEEYIKNRNDGTYTCATTNDGFDAYMNGFNTGYEEGKIALISDLRGWIKEQTQKQ